MTKAPSIGGVERINGNGRFSVVRVFKISFAHFAKLVFGSIRVAKNGDIGLFQCQRFALSKRNRPVGTADQATALAS